MKSNTSQFDRGNISTPHKANNQIGVRNYNERLILHLIRNHGALAKADVTRATGLSPNATSVIFKALEKEKLLKRGERVRGKVGQPSVLISLNPNAAYFLGLKIGRRSADLILMDFAGQLIEKRRLNYNYPLPGEIIEFSQRSIKWLIRNFNIDKMKIDGLGVAIPYNLWNWADDLMAPQTQMDAWRTIDLKSELQKFCDWDIFVQNDGNAACTAELTFGHNGKKKEDFLYFFIGTLIGGGIVLNGNVFEGKTGKTASLGAMPIPGRKGLSERLVDHASLIVLEQMIAIHGGDPTTIYDEQDGWRKYDEIVKRWIDNAARGLAHAIVSSLTILEFELIIIDGNLPEHIRDRLVIRVSEQLDVLDLEGLQKPLILPGSWGNMARAVGAATIPLNRNYSINQNTLMRS